MTTLRMFVRKGPVYYGSPGYSYGLAEPSVHSGGCSGGLVIPQDTRRSIRVASPEDLVASMCGQTKRTLGQKVELVNDCYASGALAGALDSSSVWSRRPLPSTVMYEIGRCSAT